MNEQTAEVLKHIADKLDVPVQQLWAGLVAYAPFTYYQWQVGMIASIAGVVVGSILLVVSLFKVREADIPWAPLALVGGVGVLVSLISAGSHVNTMAEAFAAKEAPQAWAARYLIRQVGR